MSNEPEKTARSSIRRIGVVSTAVLATVLTAGAALAQSASTDPNASPAPSQATTTQSGPWAHARNNDRGFDRGGHGFDRGGHGFDRGGHGFGGFGGPGSGRPWMGNDGPMGAPFVHGSITIDAINGTSLDLSTADGWTRTVDTTGVKITRDGAAITLADLVVGDRVRLDETRNDDGTFTVSAITVVLPTVTGTVATVAADSFSVTQGDGTTIAVFVNDATTWTAPGSSAPGIGDLAVGDRVAARGTLRADGSLDATDVFAGGSFWRGGWKHAPAPAPAATPTPSASPQNG